MNDKELIEELREYATALRASVHVPHTGANLIERGADALAARLPTEDDEALSERIGIILADPYLRMTYLGNEKVGDLLEAVLNRLARAAVPDAATDGDYHEGLDEGIKIGSAERDAANEYAFFARQTLAEVEEERDAALAAIERIRQAVSGHPECDRYEEGDVISCGWKSAYASVLAALDGAPEPEWEFCFAEIHDDGEIYANGSDEGIPFATAEAARAARIEDSDVVMKRVKGVPAGPWLPVEGESKP